MFNESMQKIKDCVSLQNNIIILILLKQNT